MKPYRRLIGRTSLIKVIMYHDDDDDECRVDDAAADGGNVCVARR